MKNGYKAIKISFVMCTMVFAGLVNAASIKNDDVSTKVRFHVNNKTDKQIDITFNEKDIKDTCDLGFEGVGPNIGQTIGAGVNYTFTLCEVDSEVIFTEKGGSKASTTYKTSKDAREYSVVIEKDGNGIKVQDASK